MHLCTVFGNIQSRVAQWRSLTHAFPQVLTAWARTLKASLVPSFKPWYISTDILLYTSSLELIQISWNSASFDQHLSSLHFLVSGNHHSIGLLQVKKNIFFMASTSEIIWQMPFCVWFRCVVRMIAFPSLLELNSAPSVPCILGLSHVFSGMSTMLRWLLSIRCFIGKPEIKHPFLMSFLWWLCPSGDFLMQFINLFLLQYPQRLGDILELYSLLWVMAFASIFLFSDKHRKPSGAWS